MARKSRKNIQAPAPVEVLQAKERLGGYVRLSAIDRKQKGDSIENQQSIINAYIAERPELEIVEMYIDNGKTGQNFDRPAFQRMLADLESGRISGCISKDLSRLGRNSIDTGYYIEKYFPTHGFRYIAINDNYDSADGQSGGIMVSLKNLINETYALEVGRKVHNTFQMNVRSGKFVGQFAPYGYIKNPTDKYSFVIEPSAASIVRSIFEMAVGGETDTAILEWLNGNGILPPKQHLHAIGVLTEKQVGSQMLWNKGAIYTILRNRAYVGDMALGKKRSKNHVMTLNPQEDWIITPNTHEPIVSREMFEKVQSLKSVAIREKAKTHAELRIENPFIRKIFCGHCNHPMFHTVKSDMDRAYVCHTRWNYGSDKCVPNKIKDKELYPAILTILQKQAEIFAEKRDVSLQISDDSAELRKVQGEIARMNGFLKGLYESLVIGDITGDEYKDMKLGYETKIARLAERERDLRETERLAVIESSRLHKAAENCGAARSIEELTADSMDALIERVVIYSGNKIDVSFKFTDETITVGGSGNE